MLRSLLLLPCVSWLSQLGLFILFSFFISSHMIKSIFFFSFCCFLDGRLWNITKNECGWMWKFAHRVKRKSWNINTLSGLSENRNGNGKDCLCLAFIWFDIIVVCNEKRQTVVIVLCNLTNVFSRFLFYVFDVLSRKNLKLKIFLLCIMNRSMFALKFIFLFLFHCHWQL